MTAWYGSRSVVKLQLWIERMWVELAGNTGWFSFVYDLGEFTYVWFVCPSRRKKKKEIAMNQRESARQRGRKRWQRSHITHTHILFPVMWWGELASWCKLAKWSNCGEIWPSFITFAKSERMILAKSNCAHVVWKAMISWYYDLSYRYMKWRQKRDVYNVKSFKISIEFC